MKLSKHRLDCLLYVYYAELTVTILSCFRNNSAKKKDINSPKIKAKSQIRKNLSNSADTWRQIGFFHKI